MLDREGIRRVLIEILENDTGEKPADLEDAKTLTGELGLDSVDVVSMMMQVERRFRIRLTQQDVQTLETVGDLLNLLEGRLAAAPGVAAA
jgi:acyl carrier protein